MSTPTNPMPEKGAAKGAMQQKQSGSSGSGKTLTVAQAQEILETADLSPTATTYYPNFQQQVYVAGPGNPPFVQVNPMYCLSVPSALSLMSILADLEPVGYLADPQQFAGGSPYQATSQVPWFTFQSNGAVRNAGLLAQYWVSNPGDPGGKTAEKNARLDIAWG